MPLGAAGPSALVPSHSHDNGSAPPPRARGQPQSPADHMRRSRWLHCRLPLACLCGYACWLRARLDEPSEPVGCCLGCLLLLLATRVFRVQCPPGGHALIIASAAQPHSTGHTAVQQHRPSCLQPTATPVSRVVLDRALSVLLASRGRARDSGSPDSSRPFPLSTPASAVRAWLPALCAHIRLHRKFPRVQASCTRQRPLHVALLELE